MKNSGESYVGMGSSPARLTKNDIQMEIVKCPKCKCDTEINIAKAVDENGEVFTCRCCGFYFRYAKK